MIGNKYLHAAFDTVTRNRIGVITHVVTDDPVVALTFDDGPDPVHTPRVLDILRSHDAQATFFMVGEGANCYPDIVRQVAREGHAIGNHSWSHSSFPSISFSERWRQIKKCQQILDPYGHRLFRPPYGLNTRRANLEAMLLGYKVIGWSLSAEDWCESDPGMMVNHLVKNIKPGGIILLHDRLFVRTKMEMEKLQKRGRIIDRKSMLLALSEFLERVKGNFEFVTIPDLLLRGKPQR